MRSVHQLTDQGKITFGAGYVEANDGEDLLFYYGGTTFTHAGDSRDNEHWPVSASGIGAIIVKARQVRIHQRWVCF